MRLDHLLSKEFRPHHGHTFVCAGTVSDCLVEALMKELGSGHGLVGVRRLVRAGRKLWVVKGAGSSSTLLGPEATGLSAGVTAAIFPGSV